MNKLKSFLPLSLLLLSGCSSQNKLTVSIIPKVNMTTNIKENLVTDYEDYKKIPKVYADNYARLDSFKYEISGKTVTNLFAMNVEQQIKVIGIKNHEYSYFYNSTTSNIYKSYHEAYYYKDDVLYKNKEADEYKKDSINNYLEIYGVFPFASSIEGYLTNEEGIDSVELVDYNDKDEYTFII